MTGEKKKVTIYIDESSTLGKAHKEPFFIIAAMVFVDNEKNAVKNLVKKITNEISLKRNIDELHATEMTFTEKQRFFQLLRTKNFSIQYHISRKDKIDKSLLKKPNICFNYFIYLLLKKTMHDITISEIEVIIDMRSVKVTSEKSLEEYLQLMLVGQEDYKKNICVRYGDSQNYKLLQAVDMIANAIYAKYNFNKKHFYAYIEPFIQYRELFPQKWFDKFWN